jgi:hypothetical protein
MFMDPACTCSWQGKGRVTSWPEVLVMLWMGRSSFSFMILCDCQYTHCSRTCLVHSTSRHTNTPSFAVCLSNPLPSSLACFRSPSCHHHSATATTITYSFYTGINHAQAQIGHRGAGRDDDEEQQEGETCDECCWYVFPFSFSLARLHGCLESEASACLPDLWWGNTKPNPHYMSCHPRD